MTDRAADALDTFAGPIYLVGALFVVLPLLDYFVNIWPVALGAPEWRYGAIGLLAGFLLSPLLGSALVAWLALARGDGRTQRVVAILNLAAAAFLLLLCLEFLLDVVQLRGHIGASAEARWSYYGGVLKNLAKYALTIVALVWLGRAGWRTRRPITRASGDPIVVRRSGSSGDR